MTREALPSITSEKGSHGDLRHLRRLAPFLRPYTLGILGALFALTLAAGTVLALGLGLRTLVDEGFGADNAQLLDQALMVLLGVIVLLAVATYGRFTLVSWVGERVVADIRRAVFNHILNLSPSFFEVTKTGEVLSRLTTDTTLLQVVVGSSLSMALRNVLMLIGGIVLLGITSPKLTLLVTLVIPLLIAPILMIGRRVRKLSRESQDRVADVGAYVEESINAVRTVQAFGHEDIDRTRFSSRVEDALHTNMHRVRVRAVLTVIVIVLTFSAIGCILWVGGHEVLDGNLSAGDLAAFIFYAVIVAASVGAISEVIGDLQRAAGATERLFDLLSLQPEITAPKTPKPLPSPARGAVGFENVTFAYPSRTDHPALNNFTLTVVPGEKLALVGPSGSGKSTVFQLLLRFYDPQSGHITLDGILLLDAAPGAVRARLGLVPQDPVIFSADAWENIRYGRPEADKSAIRAAAEAAHAAEFLDQLPEGFNCFLGERGVRLSGGQKQRLAIARAILRDPAVLLLDEATSALDSESERVVQDALEKLMANRTTLVIAHRLSTVLKADRIVVLEDGKIVAVGSHGELLETSPLYARLAELQFEPELIRSSLGRSSLG